MKEVMIHTDGGCEPNPGLGGWGAVIRHGGRLHELSGGAPATTNNRMELQAAIEALSTLTERCKVKLYTDSQYMRLGITQWMKNWKAKQWLTSDRKPVKNRDLWEQLESLTSKQDVSWHWLKGHAGHEDNERCDVLAEMEIKKLRRSASEEKPTVPAPSDQE
jgi:ribonuclease HI